METKNKDYYREKGSAAYAAGIVFNPAFTCTSWQQEAERAGYMQAREEWKAANPGADELKAVFNKNNVFCMKALDR